MREESALTKKTCYKATFLFSLILINTLLGLTSFINASNTKVAISLVNPTSDNEKFIFYTNVTTTGQRFNVTVRVSNVTDLFAYQILLTYNYKLLNATQAWLPKWNPRWVFYGKETVSPKPYIDDALFYNGETVGVVQIGDALLPEESTFNGTGLLAIVEFKILVSPDEEEELSTTLSIDNDDTYLLNSELAVIPAVKLNGVYRYIWMEPGLKVAPLEYVATSIREKFNVTIRIYNVTPSDRLVEVKFKLRYNLTLLNLTSPLVTEGDFLSQFNNTQIEPYTDFQFTTHPGYINISIKIIPNSTGHWSNFPRGSGTITIISFISTYQDSKEHLCKLELFDVELLNDDFNSMSMTPPSHGAYRVLPENASLITIHVNPSSATIGSKVNISGTVKPPQEGINVTISIRPANGSWTILKTVQTDTYGNYSYTLTAENIGTFELKANITDTESPIISLTINKILSGIVMRAYPITVQLGSNITLTGSVNPIRARVTVILYYRRIGETWGLLAITETNDEGNFSYTWKTTRGGAFEVYAWWPGDAYTSDAKSRIIAVTIERIPSQITINLSPSSIVFGSATTISGEIHPNRPEKDVTIWYRKIDVDYWMELDAKTDMDSHYHYTWRPREAGTFEVYAWWPGDGDAKPAISEIKTLTVNLANTAITLNATPKTITIGSSITLNGTILPKLPYSINLTIFYKTREKAAWEPLTTVNTNLNGEYQLVWTPKICTEFQLYTSWKGDANSSPANSSIIIVKVQRLNSTITIEITPSTITLGSSTLIKGRIKPERPNATVTIYFRLEGEEEWNKLKEVKTDVNSTFHYQWQTNQTGTLEIKASWKGDAVTNGTESQIMKVTVESEGKDKQPPLTLLTVSLLLIISLALTLLYILKIRK